ncbi:MAG: hypothetical protein HY646_18230 [Acidobacteria bacterium]|nr:hypothetical protein [Acidobacteriota bacterium]
MKGNMDHGQCLTEETLAEYLEGGLDPAVKAASEVHLVACDDCRLRLGSFMRLLDEDVKPQEAYELERITEAWESRRPSQKLPGRTGSYKNWFIAFAAVAASLMVVANLALQQATEPSTATEVVQLLLQQNRPFETRMSDQPHLPIVRTRGSNDPGVSYGLLAGEMTRLSADSHQMGRFYLLQKDFEKAIAYLQLAEREVGARAEVHNDLGVAYLEGGVDPSGHKAAEEFKHALELNASYAPSVFNLALLYERTGADTESQALWRRFLEIESGTPWADEARSRLGAATGRDGTKGRNP